MNLNNYKRLQIPSFNGLFGRGLTDETPVDHAAICTNLKFSKKGEISTRDGTVSSYSLAYTPVRLFEATFNNTTLIPLACDGAGHIYRLDTGATVLTVTNMIDFCAINMYNKCIIAPITSVYSGTNYLYVWDGTNAPRYLGGSGPTGSFSATETGTGNVTAGVHQFAVSFITNTGYTTTPGPLSGSTFTPVSLTTTGGKQVALSGLPTGPTGTVGRQIFATKAGLNLYYYVKTINDNTTTSTTLNFFDTDLAVSADGLFDLVPLVPSSTGFGSMGLAKYHGRLFVVTGDTILASFAGDAESFHSITGQVIVPSEFDGNQCRAAAELFGVLYIMKAVGVFSVTDNGNEPNTWLVNQIDGAIGAYNGSLSSITGSQPNLSAYSALLLANREGLFAFNGNTIRPAISWKINDIWSTITPGSESAIQICSDTFNNIIYILLPTSGSTTPNLLLMGDYSYGLSADDVRWSTMSLPYTPKAISMMTFNDGVDFNYWLRLSGNNSLYKLRYGKSDPTDAGTTITSTYQTALLTVDLGSVCVFTYFRFRGQFSGTLNFSVIGPDSVTGPTGTFTGWTAGKDNGRQINWVSEKASLRFQNAGSGTFQLQRLEIFGKMQFQSRPSV